MLEQGKRVEKEVAQTKGYEQLPLPIFPVLLVEWERGRRFWIKGVKLNLGRRSRVSFALFLSILLKYIFLIRNKLNNYSASQICSTSDGDT